MKVAETEFMRKRKINAKIDGRKRRRGGDVWKQTRLGVKRK